MRFIVLIASDWSMDFMWIVTVTAELAPSLNDQGITFRAQFASADGETWRLSKLSYLPTYNKTGPNYAWCPLSIDRPNGFCTSEAVDTEMYSRIKNVIHSMNVPETDTVLQPWLITKE